jgi:hypothetical protein
MSLFLQTWYWIPGANSEEKIKQIREATIKAGRGNPSRMIKVISVCYHVEWCTKNKHMVQIPMRGLLLICTERPLFIK